VAVIGPNSGVLETGGGSSEVTPHRRRRVYEALAERLPGVEVVHEVGCRIDREMPTIDMRLVGDALELEYFAQDECAGEVVGRETAHMGRLTWVGPPSPGTVAGESSVRIRGTFTPDTSGLWQLGLESAGRSVWRLDGKVIVDNSSPTRGHGFYGAGSALKESSCALEAGRAYELEVDVWPRSASSPVLGVRLAASRPVAGDEMAAAVAAARGADVAVVVVGLNRNWESEGFDRPDLYLPGRQDELVAAVCAANPRTVVIVNAGSPVAMPWVEEAGAVLVPWYPGEEGADALADMLVGLAEPSGRLPVTMPKRIEDTPAHGTGDGTSYPGTDGKVVYAEKTLVGYRHYRAHAIDPLFPFGHGLSYTTFAYNPVASVDGRTVTVEVTNTGERTGTEVVQAYVDGALAAFVKVSLEAGVTAPVVVELPSAAFPKAGHYDMVIGSSSADVHVRTSVEIAG
jgi:beta-glucosidase